jgi:hypothetical protein
LYFINHSTKTITEEQSVNKFHLELFQRLKENELKQASTTELALFSVPTLLTDKNYALCFEYATDHFIGEIFALLQQHNQLTENTVTAIFSHYAEYRNNSCQVQSEFIFHFLADLVEQSPSLFIENNIIRVIQHINENNQNFISSILETLRDAETSYKENLLDQYCFEQIFCFKNSELRIIDAVTSKLFEQDQTALTKENFNKILAKSMCQIFNLLLKNKKNQTLLIKENIFKIINFKENEFFYQCLKNTLLKKNKNRLTQKEFNNIFEEAKSYQNSHNNFEQISAGTYSFFKKALLKEKKNRPQKEDQENNQSMSANQGPK